MTKWFATSIGIYILSLVIVISGFFLLEIESTEINLFALYSLIFTFTVLVLSMFSIILKNKTGGNLFYSTGLNILMFIYLAVVIIVVACTRFFEDNIGKFKLVHIVAFSIYLIVFLIVNAYSKYVNKIDDDTVQKIENGEFEQPKRGKF